jgi:hypothetical protein
MVTVTSPATRREVRTFVADRASKECGDRRATFDPKTGNLTLRNVTRTENHVA